MGERKTINASLTESRKTALTKMSRGQKFYFHNNESQYLGGTVSLKNGI